MRARLARLLRRTADRLAPPPPDRLWLDQSGHLRTTYPAPEPGWFRTNLKG